jgi:Integrase zinc binding domain
MSIETLMEEGPTSLKNNLQDWKIEEIDGRKTIFFKGKNYIPKDLELRWDIVKMYHDHETAGHPGELKTYNGVRQNTGGQDYGRLWRTTFKVAVSVNNSR